MPPSNFMITASYLPIMSAATPVERLRALFSEHIADPNSSWSVGSFGAVAEFHRDAEEAVEFGIVGDRYTAATARGALRIEIVPGLRALAYETLGAHAQWSHAIALCLPQPTAARHRRRVLTELGSDEYAVRPQDRGSVLFDMGLACSQVDVCVRSADIEVVAALRAGCGRSVLEHGNGLMTEMPKLSPHRVFECQFGRAEVYQRVPPPDHVSPSGPHSHVLPKLMREDRTHAATVPIPEDWVPCAHLYPAHPTRDAEGRARPFDAGLHERFQALLEQFGDPVLWAMKQQVVKALDVSSDPRLEPGAMSRHERAAVRVAFRQWSAGHAGKPAKCEWIKAFETNEAEVAAGCG
ncbi:MAG: DUF6925 family protein [Armatimonadota bacterium]